MSYSTKLVSGITFITVPTIQYGGYFLLQVLAGYEADLGLTSFQEAMFRAGHAHAGYSLFSRWSRKSFSITRYCQ